MTTLRAVPRPTAAPPLIGVVTHELRAEADPAWAARPRRRARDLAPARLALRLSYTQAVQEAGGLAVVLPAHGYVDDTAALLDRVDGLLFSGGPDLDPAVYGQDRHPELGPDLDRGPTSTSSPCCAGPPSATSRSSASAAACRR